MRRFHRRLLLPWLLPWLALRCALPADNPDTVTAFAPVTPGGALEFPRDYGSHPEFGVEWWYLTGWLTAPGGEPLGFQVTFFRTRVASTRVAGAQGNPSAFAAEQILIAHCAVSDVGRGRLWHDQRVRREGLGLAQAQRGDTHVWIDDWQLQRGADGSYHTHITAEDFELQLTLENTQAVMLNGVGGFSQKGPAPRSASYYYSQPQLRVRGDIVRAGRRDPVSGIAWLDHEWSSQYLDPDADGWDWIGLNMNDGGALMAFRIRSRTGVTFWAAGTMRDATGNTQSLQADQIDFTPRREWRSPRTGVRYPVSWRVRVGRRELTLDPLMDDQEIDTRLSTGAIYWEGAMFVKEQGQTVGRGYLELTGYEKPLTLR